MAPVQDWRRRLMWESACCVEGLAAAAAPEMLEYVIGGVDLRLTGRDGKGWEAHSAQSCSPAAHEHSRHTITVERAYQRQLPGKQS